MDSIPRNGNVKNASIESDVREQRIKTTENGQRRPPKRVLVDRDYRQPYSIRFSVAFPTVLRGRVSEENFEYTVSQINCMFEEAESYTCKTCSQTLLGYFTVGFIYNCWDSKYERCIKQVSKFVEEQNMRVYAPLGLFIKDPALKAFRNIELEITDDCVLQTAIV